MSTITSQNGDTGANSTNTNTATIDSQSTTSQTNVGTSTNVISFAINTGENIVTDNTTVGPVATGDAVMDVEATSEVNGDTVNGVTTTTTTGSLGGPVVINAINRNTGFNSTNTNDNSFSNTFESTTTNIANILNEAIIDANTGNNVIDGNTTVGPVTTGSVHVTVRFSSVANGGVGGGGGTIIPPPGGGGGGITPIDSPITGGVGGGWLPAVSTTVPSVIQTGVGGGYFPAGVSMLPQFLIALVIALGITSGKEMRLAKLLSPLGLRIRTGKDRILYMRQRKDVIL